MKTLDGLRSRYRLDIHLRTKPVNRARQFRAMAHIANVPISVLTDSYKATHYLQYPGATKMVAVRNWIKVYRSWSLFFISLVADCFQYGEFRVGFQKDKEDTRIVAYGIRYLIDNYIAKQWTMEDVERADLFYK